jgi:uncharacterized tellurite resistance protein B-like protein
MRFYPRNSPEAAGRIVALAMLADGHLCREELNLVERQDTLAPFGLDPQRLQQVLTTLCEDLLYARQLTWAEACQVDQRTLDALMAEIDDPDLRLKLLQLCVDVVEADAQVSDGEAMVLVSAVEQWGLHNKMLQAAPV